MDRTAALLKIAHDSGDGETIFHCPFCGSGQVLARSDRTIECQFCHICFTCQVQPQFPAFPQTIDGQPVQVPGMPGQIGPAPTPGMDPAAGGDPMAGGDPNADPNAPVDPSAVGDDGEVNAPPEDGNDPTEEADGSDAPPWAKKSMLRTSTGHLVPRNDFRDHLAMIFSTTPRVTAQYIKERRG